MRHWSDTSEYERCVKGGTPGAPASELDPKARLEFVLRHIRTLADKCKERHIGSVRDDILKACLAAASPAPGLFSLDCSDGWRQDPFRAGLRPQACGRSTACGESFTSPRT